MCRDAFLRTAFRCNVRQGMTATAASSASGMSIVPFKFKPELETAMSSFADGTFNAVEIVSKLKMHAHLRDTQFVFATGLGDIGFERLRNANPVRVPYFGVACSLRTNGHHCTLQAVNGKTEQCYLGKLPGEASLSQLEANFPTQPRFFCLNFGRKGAC